MQVVFRLREGSRERLDAVLAGAGVAPARCVPTIGRWLVLALDDGNEASRVLRYVRELPEVEAAYLKPEDHPARSDAAL